MAPDTKHIAVLAFPFGTHATPLLSLVRRISASVPNLVFFFFSTAESNRKSFSDQVQSNINPCNVSDGSPDQGGAEKNHQGEMFSFVKALPGNVRTAFDEAAATMARPFDGLITDAFCWFAAEWAEELRIPWVALWTSGPRPIYTHCETDNLRQLLGINGSPEQTLDVLPNFTGIRAGDLPGGVITGDIDSPFSRMLHKMAVALPRATAVVANSYDDLDKTIVAVLKLRFQKFLNVGPFILTSPPSIPDTHGCLKWLDSHSPSSVAYISFGSFASPPPEEVAGLAAALEETKTPFLWSFRGDPESDLPEGFVSRSSSGERGKIVSWVPQLEVLKHPSVGVFVTHCGWNSVLESVVGGIPMICRSFVGEQKLNSRTVEAIWKVGVEVDGGSFSKESATAALNLVLQSEEGKKMKERIEEQKRLALLAVREDGSSTKNFNDLLQILTNL